MVAKINIRYQVSTNPRRQNDFQVKDMATGQFVGRPYRKCGWAINYAQKMNDLTRHFKASEPFIREL
jgi:hypothetical protein